MIGLLDIKLPTEVMENLPTERSAMVEYVSRYVDEHIKQYEARFIKRVQGPMGGPLSRYERSLLKDFLLDSILGPRLRGQDDGELHPSREGDEAVPLTASR